MAAADWMPIPQRHGMLLARLRDQRKKDHIGGIGWRALFEEHEILTMEQLFEPLLGRAMVENCEAAHGHSSGKYFVRATDFGLRCLLLGYMPRGRVQATEAQAWAEEIPQLTAEDLRKYALKPMARLLR